MSKKTNHRGRAAGAEPAGANGGGPLLKDPVRLAILAACIVAGVLAVSAVWAVPRPIGDLFVAMAAGRDVLDGKLGGPDDWSFTTEGRVWINQNWGTHLVIYLSYLAGGKTGVLVLKALLIFGVGAFTVLAARQRRVSWPVAVLAASAALVAMRSYIDMRPNLTTIFMIPLTLWTLYLSLKRVHMIWVSAVIVGLLWGNSHGGFLFGIGMLGLWAICRVPPAAVSDGLVPALRKHWPLLAAPVLAIVLAGVVTPFGLTNLTHVREVADPTWREVSEWRSVFDERGFGTTWEFFTAIGIVIGLLTVRTLVLLVSPKVAMGDGERAPAAVTVYEVLLATVGAAMACSSRRFIPLAIIVMAPLLAVQLDWLIRATRIRGLTLLLALGVILSAAQLWRVDLRSYRRDHRLLPVESVFDRMNSMAGSFPLGIPEFVNANGLSGRTYNEWRWEGYLHWKSPRLSLYTGGRAQQVYTAETKKESSRIGALFAEGRPELILDQYDVRYIILPGYVAGLGVMPETKWVVLFADRRKVILGRLGDPQVEDLVRRGIAETLAYPDAATAASSRAYMLCCPAVEVSVQQRIGAIQEALREEPTRELCLLLNRIGARYNLSTSWFIQTLESEDRRLGDPPLSGPEWQYKAEAKLAVLNLLAQAYKAQGAPMQASAYANQAKAYQDSIERAKRK